MCDCGRTLDSLLNKHKIRASFCAMHIFSRRLGDGSSRDSSDDFTELNRAQSQAISMSQTLLVEIRQAVNEAQPRGKMVD